MAQGNPEKARPVSRAFLDGLRAQGLKRCPVCGETKTFAAFYKRTLSKDGHGSLCKTCSSAKQQRNYLAKRDEKIAYSKAFRLEHLAAVTAREKRFRVENRERLIAEKREYRRAHPARVAEVNRASYLRHREARCKARKVWYEAHREQSLNYSKQWQAAHPEHMAAYERQRSQARKARGEWRQQYQKRGRERSTAYQRAWRAKNRAGLIAQLARRRALHRNAPGVFTQYDVLALLAAQQGRCAYCRRELGRYQVEHVMPLSRGGTNDPSNIAIACPTCNHRKFTRTAEEFIQLLRVDAWGDGGIEPTE